MHFASLIPLLETARLGSPEMYIHRRHHPIPIINIGYVSSDFNNHPLSHLIQSVFGMHDRKRFRVFSYATTPPDGSVHRLQIEREADVFLDVSSWSNQNIVERIVRDGIHVLVNLNGYTKGARNEIFAAKTSTCATRMHGVRRNSWCQLVRLFGSRSYCMSSLDRSQRGSIRKTARSRFEFTLSR